MTRRLTILTAVAALAVSAGAASSGAAITAPTHSTTVPVLVNTTAAKSTGIIMRDGGVCDPIRHMGC